MRNRAYHIPRKPAPPATKKPQTVHLLHVRIIEAGQEVLSTNKNEDARDWLLKNGYNQAGGTGCEMVVKVGLKENRFNFSKK